MKWPIVVETSEENRVVISNLEERITKIEKRVKSLESQFNWMGDHTAVPIIRACALQILLHLVHQHVEIVEQQVPECILQSIAADPDITISKSHLNNICISLMSRTNNTVHCYSCVETIAQLDARVAEAVSAFSLWPQLTVSYNDECDVISNYRVLRKYFLADAPV